MHVQNYLIITTCDINMYFKCILHTADSPAERILSSPQETRGIVGFAHQRISQGRFTCKITLRDSCEIDIIKIFHTRNVNCQKLLDSWLPSRLF